MGYTRRDFVNGALEELGLASYAYDATPEELTGAMRRLNAMMAEWNARGIRIGYPIPSGPDSGALDDATDCPDSAWEAVTLGLAIRISPSYGKTLLIDTRGNFARAYQALLNIHAQPAEMQLKRMPLGGGNKPYRWGNNYTAEPSDQLSTGTSILEF